MTNEIIYTKKDFKNAIVNKQDYIVVEGNLAKQLYRVSSIKKISAGKLRLVLGAIILGGGISTCVAGPAGATAVITAAAIKLSVDQACVIAIMMLSGTLSLSILISAFKDYDFCFEAEFDQDKGPRMSFRRMKSLS